MEESREEKQEEGRGNWREGGIWGEREESEKEKSKNKERN